MNYSSLLPLVAVLGGCMYAETPNGYPNGYYARVDLPVEDTVTVNKTVHISASPGTTVVYGDSTPDYYVRTPYQQHYAEPRPIRTADGFCLSAGRAKIHGLRTAHCNRVFTQKFAFIQNTIQNRGECLTALGGKSASGTRVATEACNGSERQKWFADGRHIRSMYSGQCLDAGKSGREVQLQDCDNSDGQRFGR